RIDLGEAALLLDASDGAPRVEPAHADGTGQSGAVTVEADPHALLAVASGAETLRAARRRGAVRMSGDRDGAQRLERLFAAISPR
ncbi:MAG TPA: SCP2 sterol-binding domain-containing protein, partial [Egibacteraceae bacterium]|nr:SCP2 sterol-binding domain-containing protein [Egibacteraceae bacterium]